MGMPCWHTAKRQMSSAVDELRDAARVLLELNHPAGARLARGLDRACRGEALETALGLHGGWRHNDRVRRRNAALAVLVGYFPGKQGRALAAAIDTAVRRYGATAWERDRIAQRRPDGRDGLVFDLLSLGGLPSCDYLRRVIKKVGHSPVRNVPAS